jgi:hypothetical protein
MMKEMPSVVIHPPKPLENPMQHDRRHDLNAEETAGVSAEDHSGERNVRLSAKSLAARGEAPDGSEDGPPENEARPDAPGAE